MDWDRIGKQWRDEVPAAPAVSVDELESRDQTLHKQVRRRDVIETVVAAVVAIFLAFRALDSAANANWVAAAFAVLLVAWAIFVPLWLRRARRRMPVVEHHMPLVEGLARRRDASLVQARMLEQVWLWYLTPPAIGIAGLTLATTGITNFTLAYLAVVLVLYVGIDWLNRRAARTKFRAHADRLQRQIDSLNENGVP